ncbi:MAG TPA: hypothetical protein VF384_15910 [Planctomycetota bacterium]
MTPGANSSLLQIGVPVQVDFGGLVRVVEPFQVSQRNWSRVAIANVDSGGRGAPAERVFLKQFVDRGGKVHFEQLDYERDGSRRAALVRQDALRVVSVIGEAPDAAVLAYPAMRMATPDELLRQDPGLAASVLPQILAGAAAFLRALPAAGKACSNSSPHGAPLGAPLKCKQREYGSPSTALSFKGLDVRNIGVLLDEQGRLVPGTPVIFDLGRPYLAPIEEAAAKLFVSCGLLNWGLPLRRFLSGPDPDIVAAGAKVFAEFLDPAAIEAEIALQQRFRLHDAQGSSGVMRLAKRLIVATVGRSYLRQLRRACRRQIGNARPR